MDTCISSRFDRYNIFFDLWIKNALNYKFDIVIFLDGEIKEIKEKVSKIEKNKIFIIEVSKFGNIHQINNIHFFQEIFNILYKDMGYKNIIYTDPDEIILSNKLDSFLDYDSNFLVAKGFEICQYKNESNYDLNKKFLDQRNFGFWSDRKNEHSCYNKVCIFKNGEFAKTQGRHSSEINESPTFIGKHHITLLHIREICIKTMMENSEYNSKVYNKNHQNHGFSGIEDVIKRLEDWFYPYSSEIPSGIKKIIRKHNL